MNRIEAESKNTASELTSKLELQELDLAKKEGTIDELKRKLELMMVQDKKENQAGVNPFFFGLILRKCPSWIEENTLEDQ